MAASPRPRPASARAALTLLSGPAAAPAASRACLGPRDADGFITIDMGGTSFEASLVRGGAPALTTTATVNRFAMALPSMDIKTVGAGGGSIGWIDGGGLLRMGPDSAGARPGPACYGLGGARPTCSDANLVLGYLSADYFAGGRMRLDAAAAEAAIGVHIAAPLGLDVVAAAAGMYRVMNATMASAIREISVERGHDPRGVPLVCAGGAGAIHAAMIARELAIARVLVPREASILCAAGMLRTDLRHDYVRACAAAFSADGHRARAACRAGRGHGGRGRPNAGRRRHRAATPALRPRAPTRSTCAMPDSTTRFSWTRSSGGRCWTSTSPESRGVSTPPTTGFSAITWAIRTPRSSWSISA